MLQSTYRQFVFVQAEAITPSLYHVQQNPIATVIFFLGHDGHWPQKGSPTLKEHSSLFERRVHRNPVHS